MAEQRGGRDRTSTKAKLADELLILGRVLQRIRERQGLRQLTVAERLGLPASHLSKIESGTRRLDVIELIRLAGALELDPSEIMRELQEELSSERIDRA
jgi:transcriptional regulator with XRE-family HTH domain